MRELSIGVPGDGTRVRECDVDGFIELTFDPDSRVRARAVQHLCPCHVKADVERVWLRVMELAGDPERRVRAQVVHALADGSPCRLEPAVVQSLESLYHDPDRRLRRQVRKLLAHYRARGRINVL